MNSRTVKDEICEVGRMMYARKLISGYEGNISVRMSEYEIWTTPTGVSKGFLTPEMLVRVDIEGNVRSGGIPSSELKMHLRVYKENEGAAAVVHAHPVYASAYAAAHKPLDKFYMTENVLTLGIVPVAPYSTPSTEEVADSVAPFTIGHKALLLANHGALTWGKSLKQAYFLMESLEASVEIRFLAEQTGGIEIPPEKVTALERLIKKSE